MVTEKHLENIEKKIDKLDSRLDSIDVTLAKQSVSLDTHIKRTDLLEQKVDVVDTHIKWQQGAWKLIGVVLAFATLVELYLIYVQTFNK